MLIHIFNFGFECSARFCFYRYLRHRLHMCVNFGEVLRLDFYFRWYKGKSPRDRRGGPKKTIFWPFFGPNGHNSYHKLLSLLMSELQVLSDQIDMILNWYLLPILKNQHLKITILENFAWFLQKLGFSEAKFSKLVIDIDLKSCLSDHYAPEVHSSERIAFFDKYRGR